MNQRVECINLSKYNTNTINASEPKAFASNDFISKIPNYKWHINDVTKDRSGSNMGILEIYDSHHIAFRDFLFYNHYTQEFNSPFLINFEKTFVVNDIKTIRDLKKQKQKYTTVKDFKNAFKMAKIGKSYFFQNGKKVTPFYKKSKDTYVLNFSKENKIENLNHNYNEISQQLYDHIQTFESICIIFKNQRSNKFLKPNGNEYTNAFILNFGQSIPFDLWNSEGFNNNIINKLPQGKTYFLETNNAGSTGIPIGISNDFKQNNGMTIKIQLNDIIQPMTFSKFK